jgi:transcriptional regulator with XRE-family HTH domain
MPRKGNLRDKSPIFCDTCYEVKTMANVGRNIKRLRIMHHMTQDDLAERLYVSRQTISNYENGKSHPDIDMLVQLAELFETDVNSLIYGLPVTPDRKRQKRRLLLGLCATCAVTLTAAAFGSWAEDLMQTRYDSTMVWWQYFLWEPLCCLLWGSLAGCFAKDFLDAKLPKGPWGVKVFWFLLSLIGCYFVVLLPVLVDQMWVHVQMERLRAGGMEGSFSHSLPFPAGWSAFLTWLGGTLFSHSSAFRGALVLLGIGLGLTKPSRKARISDDGAQVQE